MSRRDDLRAWLPYVKPPRAPRVDLYCFHHAGGSASYFRHWQRGLGSEIEVRAVQLPGREARIAEPPFHRLDPVVEAVSDVVLAASPERCFAFFGHSLGAAIAFGVTRELRRRGARMPSVLIASGARAPHLPARWPDRHTLPDAGLVELLRDYGGTPPEVLADEELLEIVLPVIRADFEIVETSRFERGRPLDVPILGIGGASDESVPLEDLEAWNEHTSTWIGPRVFPGGHFYLDESREAVLELVLATVHATGPV